jgi:hypothetical protein
MVGSGQELPPSVFLTLSCKAAIAVVEMLGWQLLQLRDSAEKALLRGGKCHARRIAAQPKRQYTC